jgi:hypothetical protein
MRCGEMLEFSQCSQFNPPGRCRDGPLGPLKWGRGDGGGMSCQELVTLAMRVPGGDGLPSAVGTRVGEGVVPGSLG